LICPFFGNPIGAIPIPGAPLTTPRRTESRSAGACEVKQPVSGPRLSFLFAPVRPKHGAQMQRLIEEELRVGAGNGVDQVRPCLLLTLKPLLPTCQKVGAEGSRMSVRRVPALLSILCGASVGPLEEDQRIWRRWIDPLDL